MDLEALQESPIGNLVPITGTDARYGEFSYWGYQPAQLPAEVDFSAETWSALLEASGELARLDQAAIQIPNSGLLRRPTLRREAQSTSALEGTVVAFTEVLEAEAADDSRSTTPELREVLNYIRAAEDAFEWINERPITVGMLEGLQGTLTAGTATLDPGQLRTRQVAIGAKGRPIHEARFVPQPPGDSLRNSVEQLLTWIGTPSRIAPIARAALAHYQFETIHPFTDGNGRIGRLLVVLQLMRDGALRDPVLIVSPWFEARRRDYQDQLLQTSETGDFDSWVRFFSHGIGAQALDTRERIEMLLDLQRQHREVIATTKYRGVITQMADGLIEHPILTVKSLARRYEVTYQAANTVVERLVGLGLLNEVTGRSRGRFFEASDVLGVLDA
ncbi:MAG: Fic family protein [Thermoleophilia bacterium]|nr:Fic family protein [Thermoleophilia bacterium]